MKFIKDIMVDDFLNGIDKKAVLLWFVAQTLNIGTFIHNTEPAIKFLGACMALLLTLFGSIDMLLKIGIKYEDYKSKKNKNNSTKK